MLETTLAPGTVPPAAGQFAGNPAQVISSSASSSHFLDSLHPVFVHNSAQWRKNEKRWRGGQLVYDELMRFKYERQSVAGQQQYLERVAQAVYVNFPDILLSVMMGHLARQAPRPGSNLSFGALGDVRRGRQATPSRAELLYYNVDGAGVYGSQWDPYWCAGVMKRAGVTGHRWMFCETPSVVPGRRPSLADERRGFRPYFVEHSPLSVTNWDDSNGDLQFAIVRVPDRRYKIDGDSLRVENDGERGYLLYTAAGFRDFGTQYDAGGWWRFNSKRELLSTSETTRALARSGWENTLGRIPMWPAFYERATGTDDHPMMSRGAVDELGQVAVALMNLISARHFDAHDAAASILYFLGADPDVQSEVADQWNAGSRIIGVPPTKNAIGAGSSTVGIHDGSTGTVAAEVFDHAIEQLLDVVKQTASMELTSEPGSSGASKVAGFNEAKSPRLAALALELETAQNIGLYFASQRWGVVTPDASTTWPTEFEVVPMLDRLSAFVDLQARAAAKSATATSKVIGRAAREVGLVTTDEDEQTIVDEVAADVEATQTAARALDTLTGDFTSGGGGGAGGDTTSGSGTGDSNTGASGGGAAGDVAA